MLLPDSGVEPCLDEVVSLLYGDDTLPTKSDNNFAHQLLEPTRARDFLPVSQQVPTFRLEWTHKKGKRKPQQFWIYCEGSQQNYVRVDLTAPGFSWTARSVVRRHKAQTELLLLVENYREGAPVAETFRCLSFHLAGAPATLGEGETAPCIETFVTAEDMEEVAPEDLQIHFSVVRDHSFPVHPQQGDSDQMSINQNLLLDKDLPFPFCYIGRFTFKNREEGWFRLRATLHWAGRPVLAGESDLFMFNNPRMKCKKHLSLFTPSQIKFMQVYSLTPLPDQDYWLDLAIQLGFGVKTALQLLQLALDIFVKSSQSGTKAVTIKPTTKITGADGETELVIAVDTGSSGDSSPRDANLSPLKKRQLPQIRRNPPAKKPAHENDQVVRVRAFSLPAIKLGDRAFLPHIDPPHGQMIRRADTGPQSPHDTPAHTPTPSASFHSLKSCPSVPGMTEAPFTVAYQFLTEDMSLEAPKFSLLPCDRMISIDQFILRIENERDEVKGHPSGSHRGQVRHLYALQRGQVEELTDTMDLHTVFSSQNHPTILLSTHDDESPPSRALFSLVAPFRPRRR